VLRCAGEFPEDFVSSFHADPNLVISTFRLILDGLKELRTRRGQSEPGKTEETLKKGVEHAEKMSAKGASADEVVSAIQSKLEQDLGPAARDEIIGRASSILALTEPFEIEAFQYYKNLLLVLTKARDSCESTNIFKLRGSTSVALELPQLSTQLLRMPSIFEGLTRDLRRSGQVVGVETVSVKAFLTTGAEPLMVVITLDTAENSMTGRTYGRRDQAELALKQGDEANQIRFRVARYTHYPFRDFDIRLTGEEFRAMVSAIFADVSNYAGELAREQKGFREQIAPALKEILNRWPTH
jgi:hypothetical protein